MLIRALQRDGHYVFVAADLMRGASDDVVAETATAERRLLITEDFGFGDRAVRGGAVPEGLLLVHCRNLDLWQAAERVAALVKASGDELGGRLTVVEDDRVRSRQL
jgi:predicted nuclease of predicted toxin-antitoxin system